MGVSRRQILAGSASALWLSACGGGGGSDDTGGGGTAAITWTVKSRGPQGRGLSYLREGNGKLLALGSDGIGANADKYDAISYRNADGNWVAVQVTGKSEYSYLVALAFGNGRFVTLSSRGEILTSTDGLTWTMAVDLGAMGVLVESFGCAYVNGKFVVTGIYVQETRTFTSVDGLTWSEPSATAGSFGYASVDAVNGALYIYSGALIRSLDTGTTWHTVPITVGGVRVSIIGLGFGDGLYVAATDTGIIATSPDFATWTVRVQVDSAWPFSCVAFSNGHYFVGRGKEIFSSPDGTTWSQAVVEPPSGPGDGIRSILFDGTKYLAVGSPGLTVEGVAG